MRRAVADAAPGSIILAETELWPNLIEAAGGAGIPIALVNGRISDRTIGRYRFLRRLMKPILERFAAIAAQSPIDAERFVSLGASTAAVRVTGNMKHDVPAARAVSAALPWTDGPLVVAGSLRDGEEEIVAEALRLVAKRIPGLRIVAAPRHLYRSPAVGRAFHSRGFRTGFRSSGGPGPEDNVLILDTMGELLGFYARATVAFVGGTLLPFGGHNLVEPAALGVPVVHGPFVANCRLEAEALARNGASAQAPTTESLARAIEWFLIDPAARERAAEAGRRTADELSGATGRTIDFLKERGVWPA
jgi:3-deoxy-D-manno-octulosonic-acid transferase